MELAKGKSAVEVTGPQELIKTLEAIKAAVEAGELDAAIDTASQSLREGFTK
jgi:soluble cytochrome b562